MEWKFFMIEFYENSNKKILIKRYKIKLTAFEIFNFQVEVAMTFNSYDNYGFN